jgi:protein tyrosine phosphatase (PTP) superfamily phosphohydrolase (DUF442 family)
MNFARNPARALSASFFAVILLSAAAAAQTAERQDFSNVRIKNFGRMDERFYRGARPQRLADVQALKDIGINTVVNLQAEAEPEERQWVESLGMKYVQIPMVAKKYPTEESVAAFLKLVDDPATGKFFLHCAGGRHRTGALGAVYRYEKYGWDYDQVYAEMKKFDFYTRWGHGSFKEFVGDYYKNLRATRPEGGQASVATQAATR